MKKVVIFVLITLTFVVCTCQRETKSNEDTELNKSLETTKNLLKSIEKMDALSDEIEQDKAELDSILSIEKSQDEHDLLDAGRAFRQSMADSLGISP